jgi:FtsZ-binding cell division protein ZapB
LLSKSSESEYFRSKDLLAQESERRSLLQSRENEISTLRIEIDHVKHTNAKYVEDSHELQSSIEALNRHVALLTQQNYEVNFEIF